jgi:beta-glucosidase
MSIFPKSFFWGVSTASHQIEGGNVNDWTKWEKENAKRLSEEAEKKFKNTSPVWEEVKARAQTSENYISGKADESYENWQEDLELLKNLGVNAYRFSIEWSRVEPEEGKFNEDALQHYKKIIEDLHANKITPFITILHRTLPLWIEKQGGWSHKKTVRDFEKYTKKLVWTFGEKVTHWMPLNEPVLNVGGGFVAGIIPPARKNIFAGLLAYHNLIEAHNEASKIIHAYIPHAQVGTAHAAVYAEAENGKWYNQVLVNIIHYFANWKFLGGVKHHTDFFGIQYYTRGVLGFRKNKLSIPLPTEIKNNNAKSDMGQEIYPQGLYNFAEMVYKKYKKPIIVTENGIADRNDSKRPEFLKQHVAEVEKLIHNGINIQGYFHWSLLDNFEWDTGFWPRFGLVEIDRTTLSRTPRKSFEVYKEIIQQQK